MWLCQVDVSVLAPVTWNAIWLGPGVNMPALGQVGSAVGCWADNAVFGFGAQPVRRNRMSKNREADRNIDTRRSFSRISASFFVARIETSESELPGSLYHSASEH